MQESEARKDGSGAKKTGARNTTQVKHDAADQIPNNTNTEFWLRLAHAPGAGPVTKKRLLDQFGSARAICETNPSQLKTFGLKAKTIEALHSDVLTAYAADLDWQAQTGNHLISYADPNYPNLLRELEDPPVLLYLKGDPEVLCSLQLSVVGSRRASPDGIQTALQFAKHLAACGITITSGLALGIDGAAHEGALAANGLTLAVAATGLDRIYPAKHETLARKIAEQGAIVSEFAIGTPPKRENFPRRNRIISGLATGTLVIEAALRSGSLITARHAMEQSREVFAIPGSIHNPMAKGCHQLIRQGAKLVETADDILEELAPLARLNSPSTAARHPQEETPVEGLEIGDQSLLAQVGYEPTAIDTLVERSGLSAAEIASSLLILELNGRITNLSGGRYQRIK